MSSELENYAGAVISKEMMRIKRVTDRITLACLGVSFRLRVEKDVRNSDNGRTFVQVIYDSPCSKTGVVDQWKGRKWYLSEFMTDDEIVKTCYAAFEAAVKHEIMEGFKVDGKTLFNPHIDFEVLLKVTNHEVSRADVAEKARKLANRDIAQDLSDQIKNIQ